MNINEFKLRTTAYVKPKGQQSLYTNDAAAGDLRLSHAGNMFMIVIVPTTASLPLNIGELTIRYTVRFSVPAYEPQNVQLNAGLNFATISPISNTTTNFINGNWVTLVSGGSINISFLSNNNLKITGLAPGSVYDIYSCNVGVNSQTGSTMTATDSITSVAQSIINSSNGVGNGSSIFRDSAKLTTSPTTTSVVLSFVVGGTITSQTSSSYLSIYGSILGGPTIAIKDLDIRAPQYLKDTIHSLMKRLEQLELENDEHHKGKIIDSEDEFDFEDHVPLRHYSKKETAPLSGNSSGTNTPGGTRVGRTQF